MAEPDFSKKIKCSFYRNYFIINCTFFYFPRKLVMVVLLPVRHQKVLKIGIDDCSGKLGQIRSKYLANFDKITFLAIALPIRVNLIRNLVSTYISMVWIRNVRDSFELYYFCYQIWDKEGPNMGENGPKLPFVIYFHQPWSFWAETYFYSIHQNYDIASNLNIFIQFRSKGSKYELKFCNIFHNLFRFATYSGSQWF